jgi:diguanylate cyclase (GGDEF)-like protein
VSGRTWKAWLAPGGLSLVLAAALVHSSLFATITPSLAFYYFGVFGGGLLVAWRFHSSRVLFSLLVLLLAQRAVDFFAADSFSNGPGRTAIALVAVFVPLNFIAFASMRERGLNIAGVAPRFGLLVLESAVFAALCRPANNPAYSPRWSAFAFPLLILLSTGGACAVFARRFLQTRKPIEPGFAWSIAAVYVWLQFAPVGKAADAYVATAALILAASMIETSYVLAYHDELTGIRGRRAFNESLLSLDQQYSIAIVDIDHFKKFNDSYGHDVGDQVLCMVATRLTEVGGDGQAFRCGGEEFAIVFRNTSAKDAFERLDALRQVIEKSTFQLRGTERRDERRNKSAAEIESDRRAVESDRRKFAQTTARKPAKKLAAASGLGRLREKLGVDFALQGRGFRRDATSPKLGAASDAEAPTYEQGHLFPLPPIPPPENLSKHLPDPADDHLSVTVSIGVAEPSTRYRRPEQVIQAADQALYRAKHKGRNRVELASTAPLRLAPKRRAKVSRF